MLPIALAYNKYMVPYASCPWGCSEFILHLGFVSIDIIYQQYLSKVKY